jgi:hypothetical protein
MIRSLMSAVFVTAMSAAMAAQSNGTMNKDDHASKMAKMDTMAADTTYTGCLQAGNAPGTFVLNGADEVMKHSMHQDMKAGDGMSHDTMMATALTLMSTSVDLRKHVGRRVSVTGVSGASAMDAMGKEQSTFTVKTLKTLAKSCSAAK